MADQISWELVDRYLAGEATPSEQEEVRAYLATCPDGEAVLRRVVERVTQSPHEVPDARVWWPVMHGRVGAIGSDGAKVSQGRSHERVLRSSGSFKRYTLRRDRMQGQPPARERSIDSKWSRVRQQTGWFTAAAIVAGLMLMLGWSVGVRHVTERMTQAASIYSTRNGERGDIMLPDGSRVALSVASRLEVPADYATGNRTVELTGEALFTVPHHAGAPFTVVAGAVRARVLGTSFLVRHYTTDTMTTVAVQEGKVAVRTVVLTTARQVVITPTGAMQVRPARPSQFTFASGIMTLDSMPLVEAITALDRWYDVDIRIEDPTLAKQQIKGEFSVGSVADLTSILKLTFNARVVRNGRVLMLYPQER